MKPTMPGTPGDPAWQGTLRMSNNLTFITDGGLAVDAAIARPAALPTRKLPAKVLEDYLKASHRTNTASPTSRWRRQAKRTRRRAGLR